MNAILSKIGTTLNGPLQKAAEYNLKNAYVYVGKNVEKIPLFEDAKNINKLLTENLPFKVSETEELYVLTAPHGGIVRGTQEASSILDKLKINLPFNQQGDQTSMA
jgi:hypothetical protein